MQQDIVVILWPSIYNMPEMSLNFLSEVLAQYKNKTVGVDKLETERDKTIYKWLIRIINSRFINVVEEPEQNLYPESQAEVLYYLLQCFNTQSYNTTEKIENKEEDKPYTDKDFKEAETMF